MSADDLVKIFQEKFDEDITNSVSLVDDEIEIFGVFRTNALEILADDHESLREVKLEWVNTLIEEARAYVDGISDIWNNSSRIKDLSRDIKNDDVAPFIGAGMSVDSGFQQWGDFLAEIRKFSKVTTERFLQLITNKNYELLATEICDGMDESMNMEVMRSSFQIRLEETENRLSGPVRMLPFLFRDLVITTNYDNVVEVAYSRFGLTFEKLLGTRIGDYHSMRLGRARILAKLHGDLFLPSTRILTIKEYEAVYSTGSTYRQVLEDIYRSNQLLFLGCSLDVDRTLDVFNSARVPNKQHYAFLPVPTKSIDRETIHDVIRDKENALRAMGILAIWYTGNHSEAIQNILLTLMSDKRVI